MEQWLMNYAFWLKFGFFAFTLALFAWWESIATWRSWMISRRLRWQRHISLSLISQLCLRVVFPFLALGVAAHIQTHHMGLLNQTDWPMGIQVILGVLALDFVMYLQHRMLHKFKWLWWIHRVHHMDLQIDVSTGMRFHPLEEMFMMAAKILGIAFFGISMLSVFIFEILFNIALLFTHVNSKIKPEIEKKLRLIIVTPSMHRIHHSDTPDELNSNYGFCFSFWDRLMGTYTSAARTGERQLVIGLEQFRAPKYQTLENMLWMPFNIKKLKPSLLKPKKLGFKIEDKEIPQMSWDKNAR